MRSAWLALALLLLLSPLQARAHTRSTSTSSWQFEPGPAPAARVVVRTQWSDLQRVLPELAGIPPPGDARAVAAIDDYLTRHVTLGSGDETCAVSGPVLAPPSPDVSYTSRAWYLRCTTPGPAELRITPFLEAVPNHLHIARIERPDGTVEERVFVLDRSAYTLPAGRSEPGSPGEILVEHLRLGVGHIATGFDHLTFLLALLLIGVSIGEMATIVTGFTLAHSLTLALGVLGVIRPQPAAIEALIGFSIVVVALENFALTTGPATRRGILVALAAGSGLAVAGSLLGLVDVPSLALLGVAIFSVSYLLLLRRVRRPTHLRWFVALVFGLIHGFGFAGLLVEVGLPRSRLVPALVGFNVGVELGQLAVVAAVWPLLHVAFRAGGTSPQRVVQAGSAPVLVAGLYWFLTRALAG